MKMKKIRNILIIAIALIAPTVWMTMNVIKESTFNCRVCMSFNGNHNSAKAIGCDRQSCITTGRDNACALIASGMTASIQCSQSEPVLVE